MKTASAVDVGSAASSKPWRAWLSPGAALVLVLIAFCVLVALRAVGQLGPRALSPLVPFGFVIMSVLPFVLMNRGGTRQIGFRPARSAGSYLYALLLGAAAAAVCYLLGSMLFGRGPENWYVSIANGYRETLDTTGMPLLTLHLIFTLPALIFSPIGEESFFRGLLERALGERVGATAAASLQALAFGLVHLLHHGLVIGPDGVRVLGVSAAIWVVLMFLVAMLFSAIRRLSGSLYPAMLAHAAFNLAMNGLVFAYLW